MQPRATIRGMKFRASPGRRAEAVTRKTLKKQSSSSSFFSPRPSSSWMRRVSALSSRLSTAVRTKKRIAACSTVPERRGRFSPRITARLEQPEAEDDQQQGTVGLGRR